MSTYSWGKYYLTSQSGTGAEHNKLINDDTKTLRPIRPIAVFMSADVPRHNRNNWADFLKSLSSSQSLSLVT